MTALSKTIALTGATGFAGGPILAELLQAGHAVKALVRRPQDHKFDAAVRVIKGDLDDHAALKELAADADVVVHVAGAISALNEAGYFKINYAGTRNICQVAKAADVKRFIHVSSLAARNPELSPYAASKRAAEDFLFSEKCEMAKLVLRPSAVYGPGDKATLPLIAALQKSVAILPGRQHAKFSLVHVRDFARVVAASVNSAQEGLLEIDDRAGGHDWAELAAINRGLTGKPGRVAYLPKPLVNAVALASEWSVIFTGQMGMVNRGKVNELYHTDWVARGAGWPREDAIGLKTGLAETLDWYQAHGWLPPHRQKVRSAP